MNKFIACGVPRSGTTALASLLNWHPTVFCGIERFPLEAVDHSFFTREAVRDRAIPSQHLERNIETLDQKGSLDALGDKGPRYFYRLAGSREAFADVKLIFIIRSLPHVFNSWNQRAFNPKDRSWHRGQTGVFAYLDTLQMLYALSRIKESHETVVLGYEQLFYGDHESQHRIIDQLFTFLGAPNSQVVHDQFDAESAKRQSLSQRKLELSPQELEFIEFTNLNPLSEALSNREGVTSAADLSSISLEILNDFWKRPKQILAAIDNLLLPETGFSQAITIIKFCYSMSGLNNIYFHLSRDISEYSSSIEILAYLFRASHEGNDQLALTAGERLLERHPDCLELLLEMSRISRCPVDRKRSVAFRKTTETLPSNQTVMNNSKNVKHGKHSTAATSSGGSQELISPYQNMRGGAHKEPGYSLGTKTINQHEKAEVGVRNRHEISSLEGIPRTAKLEKNQGYLTNILERIDMQGVFEISVFEKATSSNFDEKVYLQANHDLLRMSKANQTFNAHSHFLKYGEKEGRLQLSAALNEQQKVKYELFKPILKTDGYVFPAGKDHFPIINKRQSLTLNEYEGESAHPAPRDTTDILKNNPAKLYLDLGCGLRNITFANCLYVEVYPSLTADLIVLPNDQLPLLDESLDGVFCMAVLEHVEKPWETVREIQRILKPGGKVVIGFPFMQPFHGYPHHYFNATRKGLESLFVRDFDIQELSTRPHQSASHSLHWMLSLYSKSINNLSLQEEFESKTVRELLNEGIETSFWRELQQAVSEEANFRMGSGNTLIATKR